MRISHTTNFPPISRSASALAALPCPARPSQKRKQQDSLAPAGGILKNSLQMTNVLETPLFSAEHKDISQDMC